MTLAVRLDDEIAQNAEETMALIAKTEKKHDQRQQKLKCHQIQPFKMIR